ncbi:glycosyltransferase family 1 protein [Oceanobacillus sojae]|uniref:glycosyltransferase family 1 protein n=1 Tax=Oceanobacillus sojae TaxID=582851 RepID=UPI0021A879AD|nr:glycosyltransferase family 1 protein [Oceanobacillus sojae]MCT1901857.1 glycosyltransferase family 1 protein [Oceanobacillus sojae]
MIRVLHIVSSMNRGGIEAFLMNIYRNIDRSKIQFDFLLHTEEECAYNDEIRELGGIIYSIPPRSKGYQKNKKALESFFKEHRSYKIIHQHVSSLSYITPVKVAKKYNIPIRIIHSHNVNYSGSKVHKYLHIFNKLQISKYVTSIRACSQKALDWVTSSRVMKKVDCQIINNAIDIDLYKYNIDKRKKYRQELNLEGNVIFGHIGRFHKQKNHSFLIDIFKQIQKQLSNSKLMLIGSGAEEDAIKLKVEKYNLQDKVIFTGNRSDVPDLFQAMDVFVFPSLYEGLGIVLIEAQAAGLKCFTSKEEVPKEVGITDLVNFVSLNKSAKEWADEIMENLNYFRDDTSHLIESKEYGIKQVTKQLENFYISSSKDCGENN